MINRKKYPVIFLLIVFGYILSNQFIYNYLYKSSDYTPCGEDSNILAIGASHVESGINPEVINKLTNVGYFAEPLILTYGKLNYILNNSNRIDTVILSINPGTFSQTFENVLHIENYVRNNLIKYKPFIDSGMRSYLYEDDYIKEVFRNKFSFGLVPPTSEEWKETIWQLIGNPTFSAYKSCGGFIYRKGSNINPSSVERRLKEHYYVEGELAGLSDLQIEYFNKIIDLCNKKEKRIVLIRTPENFLYRKSIPDFYSISFIDILEDIQNTNPEIKYFDYSAMPLSDSSYFDPDHLNGIGSEEFSIELRESLLSL